MRETRKPSGAIYGHSFYTDRRLYRVGGPAVIAYFPDGSVEHEEWRGTTTERHRIDGPAETYFDSNGTVTRKNYWIDGSPVRLDEFGPKLAAYDDDRLVEELSKSSYAELLDEGISPAAVVEAITAEVFTPEGIREMTNGAPAEWVRSFEEGRS